MQSTISNRAGLVRILTVALLAGANIEAQTDRGGRMTLINGDVLKGAVSFIDTQGNVAWKHPLIGAPVILPHHYVQEIVMPKANVRLPDEKLQRLDLQNGDRLRGRLEALDAEGVSFVGITTGPMRVPRELLSGLELDVLSSGLIFSGPIGTQGWTAKSLDVKDPWQFHDGALHAYSLDPIGRVLELPDRSSIQFSTASPGPPLMRFTFYASQIHHPQSAGYYVLIGQKDIFIGRHGPNLTGNDTSPGTSYSFDRTGNAVIRILTDLEKREVILLIDGNLLDRWISPGDTIPQGRGIVITPKSRNPLAISDIRVASWDGRVPKPGKLAPAGTQDRVTFVNGDIVDGTLASIGDTSVVLETSSRELEVPLARVARVEFAQRKEPAAAPKAGLTRLNLVDGSRITLKISKMDAKMTADTMAGGSEQKLPTPLIRELKFNAQETEE